MKKLKTGLVFTFVVLALLMTGCAERRTSKADPS